MMTHSLLLITVGRRQRARDDVRYYLRRRQGQVRPTGNCNRYNSRSGWYSETTQSHR